MRMVTAKQHFESTEKELEVDISLITLIRSVVKGLITKYQWALLTEDELVARIYVLAAKEGDHSPKEIRNLGLGCYSVRLFEVVCADDLNRDNLAVEQNQAFGELAYYLYPAALKEAGNRELAAELAQDALVRIWEQRKKCREPRAFLKFCIFRMRHSKTTYLRSVKKSDKVDSMPDPDDEDSTSGKELEDKSTRRPEQQALCKEAKIDLLNRFQQIRHERPRAKQWLEAVYLTEILSYVANKEPLTDDKIAAELGVSVKNLYSLRSKGKRLLREDVKLQTISLQVREHCGGTDARKH